MTMFRHQFENIAFSAPYNMSSSPPWYELEFARGNINGTVELFLPYNNLYLAYLTD